MDETRTHVANLEDSIAGKNAALDSLRQYADGLVKREATAEDRMAVLVKGVKLERACVTEYKGLHASAEARVAVLEAGMAWQRIEGPGVDGQRVMLRELDPFDKYNRGDENRDAIASGYWSDEYRYYVWPFGCTDHPPTHWSPMPDRLPDQRGKGES